MLFGVHSSWIKRLRRPQTLHPNRSKHSIQIGLSLSPLPYEDLLTLPCPGARGTERRQRRHGPQEPSPRGGPAARGTRPQGGDTALTIPATRNPHSSASQLSTPIKNTGDRGRSLPSLPPPAPAIPGTRATPLCCCGPSTAGRKGRPQPLRGRETLPAHSQKVLHEDPDDGAQNVGGLGLTVLHRLPDSFPLFPRRRHLPPPHRSLPLATGTAPRARGPRGRDCASLKLLIGLESAAPAPIG